jgi:hypothetical protein
MIGKKLVPRTHEQYSSSRNLSRKTCSSVRGFTVLCFIICSSNIGVPDETTEGILFCPVEYAISNSGAEKVGSKFYNLEKFVNSLLYNRDFPSPDDQICYLASKDIDSDFVWNSIVSNECFL